MRRWIWGFLLLLAGGALLIPQTGRMPNIQDAPEVRSAEHELAMKRSILSSDVQLTDELCRRQCQYHLFQITQTLQPFSLLRIQQTLEEVRVQHPQMEYIHWIAYDAGHPNSAVENPTTDPVTQPPARSVSVGELKPSVARAAATSMQLAENAARSGQNYQSDTFQTENGDPYFVIGMPAEAGHSSVIAVIRQNILHQITAHQTKNLRIIPYPADKQWKMESVDSRTLHDVEVDHPEENEGTSHYHKYEVVVKFKKHLSQLELDNIMSDIHGIQVRKLDHTYIFLTEQMETKQLMAYFQARSDVVYAEPHFIYLTNEEQQPSAATPNDVLYSRYQWNLPIIHTELGWKVSKGATSVPIAIVDTGVDLEHPDLHDHLLEGYNAVNPNQSPMDDVGHGTHVTGVVAALVNNHIGVAGMTWANPVIPVKVLDQSGAGSTYAVAQGIIWATDQGARVINLSLGNYADAQFLHDAIRYAFDRDVVLIAASGNDDTATPGFPAAYPEVLAVSATDHLNRRASFSNYGEYIDVAAPGLNIASTFPGSQYAAMSGTSMASPHVTALAALIRSVNPMLKNIEVMEIIRQTATDLGPEGRDIHFGYGLINVDKALQSAATGKNTVTLWPQWLSRQYDQIREKYQASSVSLTLPAP